jgi:hypothetical protein
MRVDPLPENRARNAQVRGDRGATGWGLTRRRSITDYETVIAHPVECLDQNHEQSSPRPLRTPTHRASDVPPRRRYVQL